VTAELIVLVAAQAVSSFLSTATLHAAIGRSTWRFVTVAALSDAVKLTIYASVAVLAMKGTWLGIVAAVVGGVIGNTAASMNRRR
jgi:hypothetical protein